LDFATKREWESKLNSELPTMDDMKSFLKQRCQALEAIDFGNIANNEVLNPTLSNFRNAQLKTTASNAKKNIFSINVPHFVN
jgi:hypothetical protein